MQDSTTRFWSKVDKNGEGGCWLWLAGGNGIGYGTFRIGKKMKYAHRVSYEWLVGPIPEGLELDHLCRVHNCVNPAHLDPVTHAENLRRGEGARVTRERFAKKTHCAHGHLWSGANPDENNGRRTCRECDKLKTRRYRATKRLRLEAART